MNVTESQAIELLRSGRSEDRLRGARFFMRNGTQRHVELLKQRLAAETVYWVRNALRLALRESHGGSITGIEAGEVIQPEIDDEVIAVATETAAAMLLHEISPVIGRLEVYAAQEIAGYSESKVQEQVQQLKYKIESIAKLGSASAVPVAKEFDLAVTVRRVLDETGARESAVVSLAGPQPTTVSSDERLVELVLGQGLRNAAEVTVPPEIRREILVTWGRTDRDHWIRVADNGPGPPAALAELAQLRTTTKPGHIGAGLLIAQRAAKSLGGRLDLTSREAGGAMYTFRWPRIE